MNTTSNKKYVVLDDGIDFRTIAKIMSKKGFRMNHATARNVLISAMSNFVKQVGREIGVDMTEDRLSTLLKDQELHNVLADILYIANKESHEQP